MNKRSSHKRRSRRVNYWSKRVTKTSSALKLKSGLFKSRRPKYIAQQLKNAAPSYKSAMSMLNFYINRAGKNLDPETRAILNRAKIELKIKYKV
jgi:hypothetical protein